MFLQLFEIISKVGTGIIGRLFAKAKPFANPRPILNPVKEPGPIETDIASIVLIKVLDFLIISL